jgi:hypothetical protein
MSILCADERATGQASPSLEPLSRYTAELKMVYPLASGIPMRTPSGKITVLAPAGKRWLRSRARSNRPRQHLRALPTRTRPSLFADD